MIPRVRSRYETLAKLGRGGMAEVFAARLSGEAGFERLVAIKRMLPHLSGDSALVARFLDEARLAALVHSPHVVQTLDVGRDDDDQPFIVLELVLGVTLAQILGERPPPSLPVRVELVIQAALGLADVHDAVGKDGAPLEIVHRDVSPQNILVGRDGRARLADFGIARANLPREDTRTGVVLGKFGYMSPEQLACGALDARSDVYAMGCVAWEALTLRRLHTGATPADITKRLARNALPPPKPPDGDAPPALFAVIDRALAHDPSARYPSSRALAEALREAARELGPPVSQRAIVEEVRRAAGGALVELEKALTNISGEQRTATLTFEGATVSGVVGGAWSPDAETVDLPPAVPTIHDVRPRARPAAAPPSATFWIAVLALTVALGGVAGVTGWVVTREDEPPPQPVEVRVLSPLVPLPAPTVEEQPPPVVVEPPPPPVIAAEPERPRVIRRPREVETRTQARPGAILGADRFDSEGR
jgi:serine/threonine protein kinase